VRPRSGAASRARTASRRRAPCSPSRRTAAPRSSSPRAASRSGALPEAVEEAFDARWEHWLDNAGEWTAFFEKLESLSGTDLTAILRAFELVERARRRGLRQAAPLGRGARVPLPGIFSGTDADVALLALGFARGEPSALAVPYARRADA
jgi:hypothetical protein